MEFWNVSQWEQKPEVTIYNFGSRTGSRSQNNSRVNLYICEGVCILWNVATGKWEPEVTGRGRTRPCNRKWAICENRKWANMKCAKNKINKIGHTVANMNGWGDRVSVPSKGGVRAFVKLISDFCRRRFLNFAASTLIREIELASWIEPKFDLCLGQIQTTLARPFFLLILF